MPSLLANSTYNPKPIIHSNIDQFLPEERRELLYISFSGFLKKRFHSGNRPVGIADIAYRDNNGITKIRRVLVKLHPDAGTAYDVMVDVYNSLKNNQLHINMPEPLLCDYTKGVIFMSFVDGIILNQYIFRKLLLCRSNTLNKLVSCFNNIGSWLSDYHSTTLIGQTLNTDEIILRVKDSIGISTIFNNSDKKILNGHLRKIPHAIKGICFPLIRPHNDFSPRNILIDAVGNDFHVIDWDAMIHRNFPSKSTIWNDLTNFFISTQSMARFRPYISIRNVSQLSHSFFDGYFGSQRSLESVERKYLLWLFVLSYYLGIIGDRPLPDIYKRRYGCRYIKLLREHLLSGTGDIT